MTTFDADELDDRAQKPASASGDGGSVSQHSLASQIEYLRLLQANAAVQTERAGINMRKFKASGSVSNIA